MVGLRRGTRQLRNGGASRRCGSCRPPSTESCGTVVLVGAAVAGGSLTPSPFGVRRGGSSCVVVRNGVAEMEKYFSSVGHPPSQNSNSPNVELSSNPNPDPPRNLKLPNCQIDIDELPADPGLRKSIHEYGVCRKDLVNLDNILFLSRYTELKNADLFLRGSKTTVVG